jgi:hypothetical protein
MAHQAKHKIIRELTCLFVKRVPLSVSAVKRRHPELIEAVYAIKPS